jgi:hypothetical protein
MVRVKGYLSDCELDFVLSSFLMRTAAPWLQPPNLNRLLSRNPLQKSGTPNLPPSSAPNESH